MERYIDRALTARALDHIFQCDPEDSSLLNFDYINSLDGNTLFADGIKKRLADLGYKDICDDEKRIVKVLIQCCKNAGVNISRQTLENWLTKAAPSGNKISRENVYKLCFALKMNDAETGEFFLKTFLERPFNYKNIREAVYYFCLKTGRSYQTAEKLILKARNEVVWDNMNSDIDTEQIGMALQTIIGEDELVKYLAESCFGFSEQNRAATRKIQGLIQDVMLLAEEEYNMMHVNEKKISVNSVDDLLAVIYDYSARKTTNYKKILKASIKNSDFPKLIRRNFPERQEIENIIKGKASFDVIRKTLIMLTFYHFFAYARIAKAETGDLFGEFVNEMNSVLLECGYVQLYWRNPYDWMIGYCAFAEDPLDMLRELIYEYYLRKTE